MVRKSDRKTRLEKGTTEFTGFAAFATPLGNASALVPSSSSSSSVAYSVNSPQQHAAAGAKSRTLSPVYTGSDADVALLLKKVSQKRDVVTKTRAVEELTERLFGQNDKKDQVVLSKQEQVAAVSHLLCLFVTKLAYDNAPSVKIALLELMQHAVRHIPKVWIGWVYHQHPTLLGMLYCVQSDPISDAVRTAAHDLLTVSHQTLQQQQQQQPSQESSHLSLWVQKTTCAYVKETLAHARPQSLHDAIYGTKLGHSSSSSHYGREGAAKNKKQASNQKNSDNGDTQKTSSNDVTDDMQERYERTILGALVGMQRLVHQYPETTTPMDGDNEICDYDKLVDTAILFKCIHNNRFIFRHETYKLVTALCQYAPSLIQKTTEETSAVQKVSSMMSTCLSSEKHPSNMSALLEMLLLYMSSFKNKDDMWNVDKGGLDEGLVTKLLGKLMRKGCYGDSPSRWAPNMLPILASLPMTTTTTTTTTLSSSCHQILKCMWEGHTVFSTSTDTALLLEALVECSTYLLLRRRITPTMTTTLEEVGDEEGAKATAQLFLNALSYHLTTITPPSAMAANQTLATTLCQDLVKLDQAALDRSGCAFFPIREWFWGDDAVGAVLNQAVVQEDLVKAKESKRMVSHLVLALAKKIPETTGTTTEEDTTSTTNDTSTMTRNPFRRSHMNPLVRSLFQQVLNQYQNVGNKSPDLETSRCLDALLAFSGAPYIFDNKDDKDEDGTQRSAPETAIERFCANDLLRFMMLRSSLKHKEVFKAYFRILSHCMHALEEESVEHQTLVWESLLRELIQANCDLSLLATGLVILSSQPSKSIDEKEVRGMLQCDVLDSFAIQVGLDATAAFHNYIDSQQDTLRKGEKDLSDSDDNDDGIGHEASDRFTFLTTVVGLSRSSATLLVGIHVVNDWIKQVCRSSDKDIDSHKIQQTDCNELLVVLVSLALSYPSTLNQDEIEQVLMEAWRQGGSVWYDTVQRFTKKLDSSGGVPGFEDEFWGQVCTNFVKKASAESQQSLSQIAGADSTLSNGNGELGTKTCQVWASRALRLLEISSHIKEMSLINTSDGLLPGNSISLVGLDNVDLWKATLLQPHCAPGYLYQAFSILLQNAKESSMDASILLGSDNKSFLANAELMVLIMMCVSKDPLVGTSSWVGDPKNHTPSMHCISLLGDKRQLVPFLDSWCRETISMLSVAMLTLYEKVDIEVTDPNIVIVRCGVHVLFLLIDMMFGVYTTGLDDNLVEESVDARSVKEGDSFYYSKSSNGSEVELPRVHVKVIKVHKDDFPNLYFTIRPTDQSQGVERQTVASRLKTHQFPPTSRPIETKAIDKRERQNMEDTILSRLVKPYLEASSIETKNETVLEAAAECINIMVSRCGLTGKGGLGTTRYDVFQILSSVERKIVNSLTHSEDQVVSSLRALQLLSSAMGATPQFSSTAVTNNLSILKFDPLPITKAIVQYYELNGSQQHDISLDISVLVWVSVSVSSIKDSDIIEQLFCLLSTMCSNIFHTEGGLREQAGRDNGKATEISYLLMKALYEMETRNRGMEPSDSEEQLLAQVIGLFATVMGSDNDDAVRTGTHEVENQMTTADKAPAWKELFVSLLRRNVSSSPQNLLPGASMYSERLCAALFDPNKQWCSYQILTTLSKESSPLFPDEEGAVNHHSEKHLDSWKQALAEEEAEELHDDVHAAAKWLPHRLMNEVESWSGSTSADFNYEHEAVMGRMLSWLLCLEFMDSAASVDMRNRTCISSYLDRTGAVGVVLELSLYLANVQKERSLDWMTCTSIDNNSDGGGADTFTLSNVATLLVFRTVEALPTLAKSWWTDDCPRALQSPISQFVTNRVAPETLRRELSRIHKASTLGSMSVSGSCVSREVVATYIQDECTLSVMIRVPPTFPLRNVEVDCQKTLGIAEKRWRRWSLQIMRMLNSQDGSILDALLLWKQNVDKEFEGVEPCPICYSVLCVKTHAMPNLECKTCSNRFHSSCLFKWFQSSGKSQCVLCQQPWSGTKV